jgi:AcrR family transcriptional regulator
MNIKNTEREEMRKTQIAQAAYEVIALKGYNSFTIEDIANRAGLSKGGVLHYFKTKEDILIHLLEKIYRVIEDNIRKRSRKYKTAEKKLKAILIGFIVTAKRRPELYRVMVDFWAQIPLNERVSGINSKIYGIMCGEVKYVIDLGIEGGEFEPVDSVKSAHAIVAMIMNVAIQWTFNGSIYNIDHMTRACMSMVTAYLMKKS